MTEAEKRAFNTGYTIAVANLMNLHNEEVAAIDTMQQAGITWADVTAMNLTEYDMAPLRQIWANSDHLK